MSTKLVHLLQVPPTVHTPEARHACVLGAQVIFEVGGPCHALPAVGTVVGVLASMTIHVVFQSLHGGIGLIALWTFQALGWWLKKKNCVNFI